MSSRIIRTRTASHQIDSDGIVHSTYHQGAEETADDAQENIRTTGLLRSDPTKRVPILVDLRPIKSQSRDARSYYASEEAGQVVAAVGLVVGSRVSTLVGNFYLTVKPAGNPTKIFTSEAEALTWLKGFLP